MKSGARKVSREVLGVLGLVVCVGGGGASSGNYENQKIQERQN